MLNETVLNLVEIGIVPQSARNAGQTLTLVQRGSIRGLANGDVVARKRPGLRKYLSTISFSDTYPAAFDNLDEGDILTVHCVCELAGKAGDVFSRSHVPGSIIWRDENGDVIPTDGNQTDAPDGADTYLYRPILTMMALGWELDFDEYGAICSGSLELREV